MTNQQIQQFQLNTFNKWCELSDDEREDGHTQRYEIDMYEGQPDNDRTNDCFTNYAENQLEHPTDFIFLKSFNH